MKKDIVAAGKLLKTFLAFHEDEYCESKIGDKGNKVLYDLCKKYPKHKDIDEIIAKIWLIGRSYAAAIERRKKYLKKTNDGFYIFAGREIVSFGFDERIKKIPKTSELNERNIKTICDVHAYVTKKFKELTGLDKRSLASKYLHFHRPLVPIYDSRAKKSIEKIFKEYKYLEGYKKELNIKNADKEYRFFAEKILRFQRFLLGNKCKKSTMRDIDKFLIWKTR